MMETKFNFAYVFSVVILLIFSYITFLGLCYWTGGSLITPILLTLALIIVVAGSVYAMSMARSTRWTDIGLAGQICFGVVVLAALLSASIPFTNFLRVANEKKEVQAQIQAAVTSSEAMDAAYKTYADGRIANYRASLTAALAAGPGTPVYSQIFGTEPRTTAASRMEGMVQSLQNQLLPPSSENTVEERHLWANSIDLNVWNPMTASNLANLSAKVASWATNYTELSSKIYAGETAQPFEYKGFDSSFVTLTDSFQHFRRPNASAVIISLICFGIMLLPYFLAQGSLAAKKSDKGTINGNGNIFE